MHGHLRDEADKGVDDFHAVKAHAGTMLVGHRKLRHNIKSGSSEHQTGEMWFGQYINAAEIDMAVRFVGSRRSPGAPGSLQQRGMLLA